MLVTVRDPPSLSQYSHTTERRVCKAIVQSLGASRSSIPQAPLPSHVSGVESPTCEKDAALQAGPFGGNPMARMLILAKEPRAWGLGVSVTRRPSLRCNRARGRGLARHENEHPARYW